MASVLTLLGPVSRAQNNFTDTAIAPIQSGNDNTGGFNQNAPSAPSDGIPASWRERYFGPNWSSDPKAAAIADPDGDGANNFMEFLANTDPVDGSSFQSAPAALGTYAGAFEGIADGPRTEARFNNIYNLAQDTDGRLIILEAGLMSHVSSGPGPGLHRIRIVEPNGMVSTLAGAEAGYRDGPLNMALFSTPTGAAVDSKGNIFVAERTGNRIRKIDKNGMVSTFAGSVSGFRDGPGAEALFFMPMGVVVDADDNLYVPDWLGSRIRKITPDGIVSTYAGGENGFQDGPLSQATFNGPASIAIDPAGNLYVSDWGNGRIRKINSAGQVSTFAGGLSYPEAISTDHYGNVYIQTGGDNQLRKYYPTGELAWNLVMAGGYVDGPVGIAQMGHTSGVILTTDGKLLAANETRIRLIEIERKVTPLLTSTEPVFLPSGASVTLRTIAPNGAIRYTLNGAVPSPSDPACSGSCSVEVPYPSFPATLRARVFVNDIPVSEVLELEINKACQPVEGGLAGWWKGDGNYANATGGANATPTGAVSFDAGMVGKGFALDGRSGGVVVPDSSLLNFGAGVDFSMDAWINYMPGQHKWSITILDKRLAPPETGGASLSGAVGYTLILYEGRLAFQMSEAPLSPSNPTTFISQGSDLRDGKFHHVAVSVDRDHPQGGSLYVDGQVVMTFDPRGESGDLSTSEPLRIGFHATPGFDGFFSGIIDDVGIYRRALSSSEIQGIYLAGAFGKCIDDVPPIIFGQPESLVVAAGGDAEFSVEIQEAGEVSYQWARNGAAIAGANAATLSFTNVQVSMAGDYTVSIRNAKGHTATSRPARLYVLATAPGSIMNVSTLAGTGTAGFQDGAGDTAEFNQPNGVFVGPNGKAYIADTGNHRIREVDLRTGEVRTIAGSGVVGPVDGPGASAQFHSPLAVVADGQGNLYVADSQNHRIRKIANDSARFVTSLTGLGGVGYLDSDHMSARFNTPNGLALDGNGNLYVTELHNHTVRRVNPQGEVTTFVGNGTQGFEDGFRTAARLGEPTGLAFDGQGNLYIAERVAHRIRKVDAAGQVTTIAGSLFPGWKDGPAATVQFNKPQGIVSDADGTLYLTETGNHTIRQIALDGTVTTLSGSGHPGYAEGEAGAARFNQPGGIGWDGSGTWVIADTANNRIRIMRRFETPRITQPPTDQRVDFGQQARFSVMAEGPSPLTYQWLFNGTLLPGATNATLVIQNSGAAQRGSYAVIVGNEAGSVLSPAATLFVGKPGITLQPVSKAVREWETIELAVESTGEEPLLFEWYRNDVALEDDARISGSRSRQLTILDVRSGDAGTYFVRVTNPVGVNVSANAVIEVLPALDIVARSLPAHYSPGRKSVVELAVSPSPATTVYAIEDQAPPGWSISEVSAGGVYDPLSRKVKFGPFFDNQPRQFSYTVTSLASELGVKFFVGSVLVNGTSGPVGGASGLSHAPQHPADFNPADFRMELSELAAYAAVWRNGSNWMTAPVPIPIDYVTRAGYLWKSGEIYTFDDAISSGPLWWVLQAAPASPQQAGLHLPGDANGSTAVAVMTPAQRPGETVTMSITVRPAPGVSVYAVEERIPSGWTVLNIGQSGGFDAVASRVKWGPFFDNTAREFTYRVAPPTNGLPSSVTFAGVASFDGVNIPVTGDRVLVSQIRIQKLSIQSNGEIHLLVDGTASALIVETSTDLKNWAPVGDYRIENGELVLAAPVDSVTSGVFYRLRMD